MTVIEGAVHQQGFWVDIGAWKFDEPDSSYTWLQALPLGDYKHPLYGDISVTPEKVQRMTTNFHTKVREIDLDVDYDHKAQDGRAAGWIRSAEARLNGDPTDGLWIAVEWTQEAKGKLQDKQYKYFSSDFADEWVHPKTGQKFQDVLFGGAITNRPYLKDILPINMSEVIELQQGGNKMDRATLEKLARRLGVPFTESTTDEELTQLLSSVEESEPTPEPTGEPTPPPPPPPAPPAPEPGEEEETSIAASEIKLSDGSVVSASDLVSRLERMEAANKLSEAKARMTTLGETGNYRLAPTASTQLTEILRTSPKQLGDKVFEMVKTIVKDGIVELNERGGTSGANPTGRGGDSDSKQFSDLVEAEMKGDANLAYVDAIDRVGRMHPQLWEGYRRESFLEPGGTS